MSDSELSVAPSVSIPPDEELKESLRRETRKAVKSGGDVTVRGVRDASTEALGLPLGYYTNDKWKAISKELIHEEHEKLQNVKSPEPKVKPSNKNASKLAVATKPSAPKRPPKRRSPADINHPRKKSKPSKIDDDEKEDSLSSEPSDIGYDTSNSEEPAPQSKKPDVTEKAPVKSRSSIKKSATSRIPPEKDESASDGAHRVTEEAAASDSEMSVVLDDAPAKQRRSKSKEVTKSNSAKAKPVRAQKEDDNDPDKEEIKKLQGWLVKCGVRKVWGKELKPFETSKAKIRHLREMLTEVGMTGRFSNEKASQIKEARELAADIEAVQEGAQRWGKSEEEEEDDDDNRTRSGRRVARGAKHYDFLSSDGEETE